MYRYDQEDNSIVIDGFENGIADSPYTGIADMRNVNIISVPGEASVNFSTTRNSYGVISLGSVTSTSAANNTITFTGAPGIEARAAIQFTVLSDDTKGITLNTVYWLGAVTGSGSFTAELYSDWGLTAIVDITGNITGTFTVFAMNKVKFFTKDRNNNSWLVDSIGQVWSNFLVTGVNSYFTYSGNKVPTSTFTNGNGIEYYQAVDGTGYIFVFHNSSIDYLKITGTYTWTYQWDASAGTAAGYNATPTQKLNNGVASAYDHETLVGQDNVLYYCDASFIGSLFEKVGSTFDPTSTATYTYAKIALRLPTSDKANCLAELGTNLLIGGQKNAIYPWNRIATSFNYPILIGESVISKMVTVNTNTFIFAGNRGRIYITNGSQAQLYKKIPDHISNTVEPYFTWGGVCANKNQLYFSALVKTNSGTAINTYGGLWAIDLDTKAIRMTNKFSYNTYAGYATALIPIVPGLINPSNPVGTGMYIGWDNNNPSGADQYGVDVTSGNPYTNSQATIDSDLIPIGTFDKPKNPTRIEYKLTKPMVSGESVSLAQRTDFSQNYTTIFTDSTAGNFSLSKEVNFANAQWLQLQIVLNSTITTPSYTRLKEIRIKL